MRILALLLLAFSLTGCERIEALFLSPAEKINRAFPPPAEVRATWQDLDTLLAADEQAQAQLQAHYANRLELRALTCAKGFVISRLDTPDQVRQRPIPRDCLNAQDADLLEYLQIRQVGWRIEQPPLRPLRSLGEPEFSAPGLPIYSGIGAAAANIAVLRGTAGDLLSVEIPSGEIIAKLPKRQDAQAHNMRLSPNGRVLALPSGFNRGLEFIDTESGAVLWRTERLTGFLTWLPGLCAGLADNREGQLSIVDFLTGEARPGTPLLKRQSWATPLTADNHRIALGTERDIRIIDYQRQAGGLRGKTVQQLKLSSGAGVTSSRPTAMRNGKSLFLVSMNDLMTLDLESGQETLWKTERLIANDYAKLSESRLLVDAYDSPMKRSPWVLDIEQATITPVSTEAASEGILYTLDDRNGFLRRELDGIWFGDRLSTSEPQPLADFLSARNLEHQMAKLNAMTQAQGISSPLQSFTGSGMLPPQRGAGLNSRPPQSPAGQFATLAKGARVEVIGVYESSRTLPQGPGNRPGLISVDVGASEQPQVLVLSSYESVRWQLNLQPGSQLRLILTASYYPSFVDGAGSLPVQNISPVHAYERDSDAYRRLQSEVLNLTLRPISHFQGSYYGEHFRLPAP